MCINLQVNFHHLSSYPRDFPERSLSIWRLVPLEAGLCILWQKNDGAKRPPQIFNSQFRLVQVRKGHFKER